MYLYSGLGQQAPAIGEIVNGVQQLRADVAANVLTFLQNRYFLIDTTNTGVAGSVGYVALTPEGVRASGAQLEGLPTAAQKIGELPAQNIALASVPDTMAVLQAQPPSQYHVIVVPSLAAAQTLAQGGSDWAVLQPRGAPLTTTTKPSTTSAAVPIVAGISILALIAIIAGSAA